MTKLEEALRCVQAVRVRRGSLKKRNPLYLHIETARWHLEEAMKILEKVQGKSEAKVES